MQNAVQSGNQSQVESLFANKSDSGYLFRMAPRCGGLKNLKVAVFPTPKGWESTGKYWATFHNWQELEQDHDPVYRVVESPSGLELGAEVPESEAGGKVEDAIMIAMLKPEAGSVDIYARLHVEASQVGKALLFRLNDIYKVDQVVTHGNEIHGDPQNFDDSPGSGLDDTGMERAGGFLSIVPKKADDYYEIHYTANIGAGAQYSDERDQILPDQAYITSFWVPSLGRLPVKTQVYVSGPKDWILKSEGTTFESGHYVHSPDPVVAWDSHFPISYPKVLGGKYVVAAEGEQNGHTLRSYQFAPVDSKRAQDDLGWMKKAIAFYEANLGPFPFKEYDCFDGKNYYGIESYSYTILDPKITTWAVSHEMGHTYFGGLVPCPYVKDSWNEGMTQYVDDVLLHQNPEVAQNAFAGIKIHVPLTQMPVAWEYNGATYWRGAYAMQMLDAEIGHANVLAGLRLLIKDRVGKETTWPDLRQYFEKASGQDLGWFWSQWISGSEFPHVAIASATTHRDGGNWVTAVKVKQDGTASPFMLRFGLRLSGAGNGSKAVVMTGASQSYSMVTAFKPEHASVVASPTALVTVDGPVSVGG